MTKYKLFFILSLLFFFVAERAIKWIAIKTFDQGFFILNGIGIKTYINQGIAFGVNIPTFILYILIAMILVSLISWSIQLYLHKDYKKLYAVLLLVIGGFSNLLDRWYFSGVVDYIEIYSWPVFNLADFYIIIGVSYLIYFYLFKERREIKCHPK